MIIAVDGPLASGKGTIARALAAHFDLPYLDTGSLYRATGVAVLDAGIDPTDAAACARTARTLDLTGIDETRIRTAEAGAMASRVAALPAVRKALYELQRDFATQPGGAILDGRDIGTVICPDADVKLYITAATETRARRRWSELAARGETITYEGYARPDPGTGPPRCRTRRRAHASGRRRDLARHVILEYRRGRYRRCRDCGKTPKGVILSTARWQIAGRSDDGLP